MRSTRVVSLAALAPALAALACSPGPPPNVVLLTIESLRPQHLGPYGAGRETTPVLDALAADSIVYEDAHAVTSWTLASHASLFTGLYPGAHQAIGPKSTLGDAYATLAEILSDRGYQTAGFASGPYLTEPYNLQQGFEYYDSAPAKFFELDAHADVTNPDMEASLLRFLEEERDPARPLFLFAYWWDPHYDYIPPAPYDEMFVGPDDAPVDMTDYERSQAVHPGLPEQQLDYVVAQYDGEIRWTDEHLGRFFEALRQRGLWENSVVIVTSDHGEAFFEHGHKGHKHDLHVESVHVPLVVKYPGASRRGRDDRLVSLVDVFPTVLELADADAREHQGRSLLAPAGGARAVLFELQSVFYYRKSDGGLEERRETWSALQRGDRKLMVVEEKNRTHLYDVVGDRAEHRDIAAAEPEAVASLRSELDERIQANRAIAARHPPAPRVQLTDDLRQRLCELGYLTSCDESSSSESSPR